MSKLGGREGGGGRDNLDKIQKNSSFPRETVPTSFFRGDVWSFGNLSFEMLTIGISPIDESRHEIIKQEFL